MQSDMASPILIAGESGQLAVALREAAPGHSLVVRPADRPELDFDRPASIAAVFAETAPWLVINAAAYTAVDAAEDDADAAFRANRDGPAELARLCEAARIPLIHVSTDYVYDGLKGSPYVESDPTAPQGVYGASKLAGDRAVLAGCSRAIVLRTSWVYSPIGRNFVRTMLSVAQRTDRLRVVGDQKGCPTSAPDLAEAILTIAARIANDGWQDRFSGVCHAAGTGWTTWHGLAVATFEYAATARRARPDGRSDHHRRVAHTGTAAARFTPRLRQARSRVWAASAALAGRPGAHDRRGVRHCCGTGDLVAFNRV